MTGGSSIWDIVVVGAGPAGALAARQMARDGFSVLLVEQDRLPRDKVCGCCLSARGLEALAACELSPQLAMLTPPSYDALRLAVGGAEARIPIPRGVTIDRARLDAMLVHAAAATGATVLDETRASLEPPQSSVDDTRTLRLAPRRGHAPSFVRARLVIVAAGLANRVAADELDGEVVHEASRIGVSAVLDPTGPVPWTDGEVNMAVGRGGYVGAARLADGRWRVAAALEAPLVRTTGGVTPLVRQILDRAGWPAPHALDSATWRGTPALWRQPRRVAARRLFLIGDAAGYVEPFTGEGIACALDAGRAVAELAMPAVTGWSNELVDTWADTVRRSIQRRWRAATLAARAVRQPMLATAATALLSRYPGLAAPAVAYVNAPRQGGLL